MIPYGTGSISHVGKPKARIFKLYEEKIEFINTSDQEQKVTLDLSSQASDFVCELSTTELKIPKVKIY